MSIGFIAGDMPSWVTLGSNIACDIGSIGEVNITSSGEVKAG